MRDRTAERRLAFRALGVDVNPLMIAGRIGKTVDAGLIDRHPVADERFAADPRTQCAHASQRDVRHIIGRHDAAPGWRSPKSPFERTVITVSPCWFLPSHCVETMPRSGLLADTRLSSTVFVIRIVSPTCTGFSQRISSMPGEPIDVEPANALRTSSPIITEHVCQPLAISVPNGESAAPASLT